MTAAHTEFLSFFQSLKFTSEEDRALACWVEARRVALEDAAQVAGPEDAYQDAHFKAKADSVRRIKELK